MKIKSYNQLNFLSEFGNHGNSKNYIKAIFDANKGGSKENIGFWEFILDSCGFHGNKIIESA